MIRYHVRTAGLADLYDCFDLRRLAEESFRGAGIDQWHDSEEGRRVIRKWIDRGTMRVVTTHAGDVVACFAIDGPDQQFWTDEEAAEPAVYLYKMIVRPDRCGTGLGDAILDYASAYGQQQDAELVRIDCWKTNVELHAYFTHRGFEHVDTRTAEGRNSGWLAQRSVEVRCNDGRAVLTGEIPKIPEDGDRYDDPISMTWRDALAEINNMREALPVGYSSYIALEQLARRFETRATEQRQRNGMTHRPYTGQDA